MQKFVDLSVIDVKSPDCILVREAPNASPSQDVDAFKEMSRKMDDYFNDQFLLFDVHYPKNNEICAAQITKHGRWHRVRIKQILTSLRGTKVSCFLLDAGKVETIQVQNIRQIPSEFLQVPFQVKTFGLLGVLPLTLSFNSDIQAVQRPCKVWDKSVTAFMKDLFNEASKVQGIVKIEKSSRLFGHMYLKIPGEESLVFLNDRLVQEKYAIFGSGQISNLSEEEPNQNSASSSDDVSSSKLRDSLSPMPLKNCRNKDTAKHYGSFLPDSLSPDEDIERKRPERSMKSLYFSRRLSSSKRRVSTSSDSDSSPSIYTRKGYMQYLEKVKSRRQKYKSLESGVHTDGKEDKESSDGSSSPNLTESPPQLPQLEDIPKKSPDILTSTKEPHRKSHLGSRENIDVAAAVTLAGRGRGQGRGKLLNWGLTACNNYKDSHSGKSKMTMPVAQQDVSNQMTNQRLRNISSQSSSNHSRIRKANKSLSSKKCNNSARNFQGSCDSDFSIGDSLDNEEIIRGQSVIRGVLPSGQGDSDSSAGSRIQRINKILGKHNKISTNNYQLRSIPTLEEISSEGCNNSAKNFQGSCNSDFSIGDSLDNEEITRGQSVIRGVLPSGQGDSDSSAGSRIQRINKILGKHNKISTNNYQLRSIPTLEEISSDGSLSTEEVCQLSLTNSGKQAPKNSSNFSLHRSSEVFSSSENYPTYRKKNSDNESNNENNNKHGHFYKHYDQEDDDDDAELDMILNHLRSVRKTSNASSWDNLPEVKSTNCNAKTTIANTKAQSLSSSSSSSSSNCKLQELQFNHSTSSEQSRWITPEKNNDSKCSKSELDEHQRDSEIPEEISKLSIGKRLRSSSSNQSDVSLKKSLNKTADVQEQVVNSFQAKDFLRKFGISEKGSTPDSQESQDPLTTELILMNDSVLFVSEKIPPPIYNLQDFDVPDAISQFLKDFPSLQPRTIQAYCWRPAIRGKDIIGISPPNSGKTWAYLVPVLSNLCQYTMYADIQYSNGPLAIILVSSWIKAEEVYEQCRRLASAHKDIVVEVIYGGGAEHNKSVSLLNGCHILVATLPCLNRMMINQYTNLNRLCHLIIDEADIILEDFYSDIRNLMRSLKKQVLSKQRSNLQNQVMIFGSKWTSHVRTFTMNALEDVVIVITDMIEASIYGRVKQIPMISTEDGRERKLIELLPDLTIQGEKVIIFTDGDQSCLNVLLLLNNYLMSAAIGVLDSSYVAQREEASRQWHQPLSENEPYRFLVCSDSVLCDLKISDATCIVHYQFPSKKVHVGLRMQTMSKYYPHYNDKTVPLRLGKSYIIMVKMDLKKVKSLKSLLLNNSNGQHRDEAIKFFSLIQEENEQNPDNALCYNIKMYGKCRSYSNCNQRHTILPEVDLNGCSDKHILLPNQGDVRIMVLHVKSASHFFGRILEIWQGQKKSVAVHSDLASLTLGMATHFCDPANKKPLENLEVGILCAVNTSKGFFRVKVSKLNKCASKNTVILFFVDIGKTEEHPACNLYTIPDQFARVPHQAVEIFLCRLQPVDCDVRWSNFANSYTNLWVESKMLYGKIQFVTKNSLWLDPLLERIFLKDINSITNGTSLRRELLDQKLAVDNPEHLVLLRDKFKDYLPDEKPSTITKARVTGWESDLISEQLVPEESNQNVVISYIVHPGHFYVQKVDKLYSLSELMVKIQESVGKESKPQPKRDWTEGLHCLAIWSDSQWHRVRLTKVTHDEADVHFVDHGYCGTLPLSDLQTMSQQLMCLPAQAIRCHLAHISPVQGHSFSEISELFTDLTQSLDGQNKILTIKVVSPHVPNDNNDDDIEKDAVETDGYPSYAVELLDNTATAGCENCDDDEDNNNNNNNNNNSNNNHNVGQQLVNWKKAVSRDGHFQPAFEETALQIFTPSADKLVTICCVLYWKEDKSGLELTARLLGKYTKVCLKYPERLIAHKYPESLLKLLNYTEDPVIFNTLITMLKGLCQLQSIYCNMESNGLYNVLTNILEVNKDEAILQAVLQLVPDLHSFTDRVESQHKSSSSTCLLFLTICRLLNSAFSSKVKISVCQLLYSLCQDNITLSILLLQSHMCPHLIAEFVDADDHNLLEAYLSVFHILMKLESGLDELKREKPIHSILQIIKDRNCSKCVHICLQVCKNLSIQSRKSKTLLLELNIVPILMSFKEALANDAAAAAAAGGSSAATAAANNDSNEGHTVDDDDDVGDHSVGNDHIDNDDDGDDDLKNDAQNGDHTVDDDDDVKHDKDDGDDDDDDAEGDHRCDGGGGGGDGGGSCYDADSLRLCEELLESLSVRVTPCLDVQQQPSSDGLNQTTTSGATSSSPAIYWCQNKFRLLVTAKMEQTEDFTADFDETAIHIRPVDSNESVLATYELYDKVVISKCFIRHKPNEIQMSLAKTNPAYWLRLLETTEKFPNISKDFGRFEMDFDDDDDNEAFEEEEVVPDEDNPFTLKVKVQVSNIPEISQTILPDYENSDSESSLEIDRVENFDRFNIYDVKY